jgi:hypothetical protein
MRMMQKVLREGVRWMSRKGGVLHFKYYRLLRQ